MDKIYAPIWINCEKDIENKSFFNKKIKIRKMTRDEMVLYFGKYVTKYSQNGLPLDVVQQNINNNFIHSYDYVHKIDNSISDDSLNPLNYPPKYIIESDSPEFIKIFINSLIVFKKGVFYCQNGFKRTEKVDSVYYFNITSSVSSFHNYKIKLKDLKDIEEIIKKIEEKNKYDFILEKFIKNQRNQIIKKETRFVELLSNMEYILTKDTKNEKIFRFSLYSAFILNTNIENIKKLYKVRSKIVHGSIYDLNSDEFEEILNKSRELIKIYLLEPNKLKNIEDDIIKKINN